jgi:Tfp pilus assembly protein PilV
VGTPKGRELGFSLVEVIAFLIVMGVGAAALLPMFRNVLPRSLDSSEIVRATHLAQSRMELILAQRAASGFSGINDPCQAANPPACAVPSGYSLTVLGVPTALAWPVNTDSTQFRLITVRVTGPSGATNSELSAVAAQY